MIYFYISALRFFRFLYARISKFMKTEKMKENTGEKTTFRSTRFQTFSAQKKMLHVFSRRRSASPERKSGRRGSTGADEVVDLETFYSDDWFRSVVPMLTGIAQAAPLKNWAADRGVGGLK